MLFDGQMHSNSVKQPKLPHPLSDLYRPASIFRAPSSWPITAKKNSVYQLFKKILLFRVPYFDPVPGVYLQDSLWRRLITKKIEMVIQKG